MFKGKRGVWGALGLIALVILYIAFVFQITKPAAASALGVEEERTWSYCYKAEDAIQIANLYFDAGYEIASSAWEKAKERKECTHETLRATPQEIIWNRANMADTISIVILQRRGDTVVYWFRLETK